MKKVPAAKPKDNVVSEKEVPAWGQPIQSARVGGIGNNPGAKDYGKKGSKK